MIECPNCRTEYFIQPKHEGFEEEDLIEDEDDISDDFKERNR